MGEEKKTGEQVTYAQAGVDIEEGARAVEAIKETVHSTYRPEVVGDIGGFGGLFSIAAAKDMVDPLLVSGTDGVGTKLKIAQLIEKHETVGIDLVAMCANDILATGAEPLFCLDYVAVGKLDAKAMSQIVAGIGEGCKQAGCALIGGEMAEHPGVMDPKDYDLSGFCVGIVDRPKMLDPSSVKEGDVLVGFASSGLHSNGYSLARKVCLEGRSLEDVTEPIEELGGMGIAEALLTPTRIYVKPVKHVMDTCPGAVRALAHITGGGITENLNRALNGLFPPGSTFKVFMAAAALSAGVDPVFDCPAAGWRPNVSTPPIRDAEVAEFARRRKAWKGFGRIGMGEAMVHSANTYFAQLGYALGSECFDTAVAAARLRDSASVLSAGTIELASAAGGVPEGASASALAPVAIGQGALQLTPLAVALVTAAVADDGLILAPTLSAAAKPALRARPFTMAVAQRVKRMMRAAVRRGTGRACDIPGLGVCGKTGTAQTGKGADHAWFTCFAPEASPRLVVTVLVESGGFGAKAAVPVAREILLEAKRLGYFK